MADSVVDEIKARLDIAEVIGQYVPLKRTGGSFKGLCPFHGEKTASFNVSPSMGLWKCFGCGEGGDMFTFVQKHLNLDFPEALRMLAAKAGVEVKSRESRPPDEQATEDRLRSALEAAVLYFQAALAGTVGAAARAYLEQRGVNRESVERFGLGYAPRSGLLQHLAQAGFSTDEAVEVGVVVRRDDGSLYEMFRERLIFPIRDERGRTIAFGGRTLGDAQPKYLNGPTTRFFDKSAALFALDLARAAIRQSGRAIIVEGYLDALIAHQHGFQNVVAPLGTALTEQQFRLLKRQARDLEILLALDADSAGQRAARRGADVAASATASYQPVLDPGAKARDYISFQRTSGVPIKIMTLPPGLDPDELIRQSSEAWSRLAGEAMPVVDFVLSRLGEHHDLASAAGTQEAVQDAMNVIATLPDPVHQGFYIQRLADKVNLDARDLRQRLFEKLRALRAPQRPKQLQVRADAEPEPTQPAPEPLELHEAYVLALYFLNGARAEALEEADMVSPQARDIFRHMNAFGAPSRDQANFLALAEQSDPSLQPAYGQIASWVAKEEFTAPEERTRELKKAVLRLRRRHGVRRDRHQVLDLVRNGDSDLDQSPASLLAANAQKMREIEVGLEAPSGTNPKARRSQQLGEVLGG